MPLFIDHQQSPDLVLSKLLDGLDHGFIFPDGDHSRGHPFSYRGLNVPFHQGLDQILNRNDPDQLVALEHRHSGDPIDPEDFFQFRHRGIRRDLDDIFLHHPLDRQFIDQFLDLCELWNLCQLLFSNEKKPVQKFTS